MKPLKPSHQAIFDRMRRLEAQRREVLDQIDHQTKLHRQLAFLQGRIEELNDQLRAVLIQPLADRLHVIREERNLRPFIEHPAFPHYLALAAKELLTKEAFEQIHAEARELLWSAIELGLQTSGLTRRDLEPKPKPLPKRQPQLATDIKAEKKAKVPSNGNEPVPRSTPEEQRVVAVPSEAHNKVDEISREAGKV